MAHPELVQQDDVHPDDLAIYEQLARLQGTYDQVGQLRTLLPDKLVEPTRFARQAPPEKVAIQLRGAATAGSNQIKDFKKAYHSEDMRSLFQTVNTADFPQGHDVWTVDYAKSLPNIRVIQTEPSPIVGDKVKEDSVSAVVEAFRELHPDIKVEVSDSPAQLPVDVSCGLMAFRINSAPGKGHHLVTAKDGTAYNATSEAIVKYINKRHSGIGLLVLLGLLASYNSVETKPCQKCQKIFDSRLQLPLARERADLKDDAEPSWKVFHESCI